VEFYQKQIQEVRVTENVFAEVTGGDGDDAAVVMLGAHLDSVQVSAGVNDDGSGVSLVLEVFRAAARCTTKNTTKNTLRFAWRVSEENMGVGSKFYCRNLTRFPGEADRILAYLDFDMVAKGTYYVGDGDGSDSDGERGAPGSEVIKRIWLDYFRQIEVPTEAGHENFWTSRLVSCLPGPGLRMMHTITRRVTMSIDIEMLTTNARLSASELTVLEENMLISRPPLQAAAHMAAVLGNNATSLIPRSPLGKTKELFVSRDGDSGYS